MARNLFGGSSDDYAVDSTGRPIAVRRVRFYTSAAMTTEITDLASDTAGTGAPLTVNTDAHGFWGPVYGPDGVTTMYAGTVDSGGNPPAYVVAIYTHTSGGVASFNTRAGAVSLTKADVTATALAAADVGAPNVVVHGSTAGTARPSGATVVHWIGSVAPTNVTGNDEWTDTTNKLLKRWNGTSFDALGSAASIALGLLGNRLCVTGDSITARNSDPSNNIQGDSWATYASIASNGRLRLVKNAAHGGYSSQQLQALFAAEVLAATPAPTVVVIASGKNDSLDGSNLPTATATYIAQMVGAAQVAGAKPIMATILPSGTAALGTPAAPTVVVNGTGGTFGVSNPQYRVSVVNGAPGETQASAAVTAPIGSGTTNSVTITAPAVQGALGYKFYRSDDSGSTWGLVGTTGLLGGAYSVPVRTFTDTNITKGATVPGSDTTAVTYTTANRTKDEAINTWIRRYAEAHNIPVIDFYTLAVDPTTGMFKTGWTIDGTHPTPSLSRKMGYVAARALAGQTPHGEPYLAWDNADVTNLASNGCFINSGSNIPTGWGESGSGSVTKIVATEDGFAGNSWTIALNDYTSKFYGLGVGSGWSVGDRVSVSCRLETIGVEAALGLVTVSAQFVNASGAPANAGLCNLSADCEGIYHGEAVVPAGTTSIQLNVNVANAPCIVKVGQATLRNLTTLGLAAI